MRTWTCCRCNPQEEEGHRQARTLSGRASVGHQRTHTARACTPLIPEPTFSAASAIVTAHTSSGFVPNCARLGISPLVTNLLSTNRGVWTKRSMTFLVHFSSTGTHPPLSAEELQCSAVEEEVDSMSIRRDVELASVLAFVSTTSSS